METKNEVRLTGTLTEHAIEVTKTGKRIAKLTIETDPPAWMTNVTAKEQTPVVVFGRTVNDVEAMKVGQSISMLGRVAPREWEGKRYASIVGEKFKVLGGGAIAAPPKGNPPVEVDDSDIPF